MAKFGSLKCLALVDPENIWSTMYKQPPCSKSIPLVMFRCFKFERVDIK